jgi:hypothetical protein
MNEPPRLPDLSPLYRRQRLRSYRNRPGVSDSIERARSTLLINLIIEIVAGLILLFAIVFTVRFLFTRREMLDPVKFKLYIEILIFFTIGWFTFIGFKVRAKFLLLKKHWNPGKSQENNGEEDR